MALPFLRARPRVASGLERVICLDDPPNQLVTDNIGPSQMDKADVCDVRQNLLDKIVQIIVPGPFRETGRRYFLQRFERVCRVF